MLLNILRWVILYKFHHMLHWLTRSVSNNVIENLKQYKIYFYLLALVFCQFWENVKFKHKIDDLTGVSNLFLGHHTHKIIKSRIEPSSKIPQNRKNKPYSSIKTNKIELWSLIFLYKTVSPFMIAGSLRFTLGNILQT